MPPHVLLAAKLIAIFLLAHYAASYSSFGVIRLDPLSLELLRLVAQGVAVVSTSLLLFNRGVREMSIVLGLSVAFEFAVHWVDYGELFLGVFLFLAALQRNGREPLLLRYQVVFSYLAVGLTWLFGSASALLSEDFASRGGITELPPNESYLALEAALTPGLLVRVADWAMILVMFALAAGFLFRRFYPLAIWVGIVLHCAWGGFAGSAGVISYAILASYLVFVGWPRTRLLVLYDGDCGFCNKTREWISKADFDAIYDWKPYQSGAGEAHGISEQALEQRVHVVLTNGIHTGFQAFRTMVLYNPLTYFAIAVLLIALGAATPLLRNWFVVAVILFFSPVFRPIGEATYNLVARHRHRLPPRTCKVPEP